MKFKMAHTNINVLNLERSLAFYQEALGLQQVRTYAHPEGEFTLVYVSDESNTYQIEFTWYRDRKEAYTHGDNDLHLAFAVDDFDAAYQKHTEMECICYENKAMGIYFIKDPDGYWLEVVPEKK
ncbi:MAG: VOC family protein [Proteobacteria bacterium]|nr:lactoylglutathione lyase [Desulfobulbaceae bacterium]MBU4151322.1 VOC family protein [Pseudomonadota bacterium]MDP2105033.1 VOC family protein [Desulfobulbaceae bacterium]